MALHNSYNNQTITTGDHDGGAAVIMLTDPFAVAGALRAAGAAANTRNCAVPGNRAAYSQARRARPSPSPRSTASGSDSGIQSGAGACDPNGGRSLTEKSKPMTDTPDLPSPDEFRRKMAHLDREFADARRYLSSLHAEDNESLSELMAEIHHGGRAMKVLAAMAVQALDFAELATDRLGGDVQKWLDESVMAQDTTENERDHSELGGEA